MPDEPAEYVPTYIAFRGPQPQALATQSPASIRMQCAVVTLESVASRSVVEVLATPEEAKLFVLCMISNSLERIATALEKPYENG